MPPPSLTRAPPTPPHPPTQPLDPSLHKVYMCPIAKLKNECSNRGCPYAHKEDELRKQGEYVSRGGGGELRNQGVA